MGHARTDAPIKGGTTKIVIGIVCRNALPALEKTIDSIRRQADPRVLTVIVDGASTDGTAQWLRRLDRWVYRMISEPDHGIYDAMNKVWALSPNDAMILFLGAGDLLYELPEERWLRDERGQPVSLVLGDTCVGDRPYRSRWTAEMRLRNTAHHQALILHRRVSANPPFDAGLRAYADWDFNLRLFRAGLRGEHVPGFRTYAAPGGESWFMDLKEIRLVAGRNSGWLIGAASWALNSVTRWRRRRREATSGGVDTA